MTRPLTDRPLTPRPFMARLLALALLAVPGLAAAQDAPQEIAGPVTLQTSDEAAALDGERDAVRAVIASLFDGMRAADTSAVRAAFHPGATLQSVVPAGDGYRLGPGSIDAFVAALGQPHDAAWDERVGPIAVEVDAGLAQAWMDYAFYAGDTFSHCGVNAMQLVRTDAGWQILHIVDTRRRECKDR